jgi:chorismatase
MWNFIDGINADNADRLEVYRDFCLGRAAAFDQLGVLAGQLPAATGIGSRGGGIAFYLVATRTGRQVNIENGRQVPAYHYPRLHGPRSPSFARATYLLPEGAEESTGRIYVSGTASIVGHLTMHAGDITRQCQETLANITHLVSADNLAAHGVHRGHTLTDLRDIKIYVRHHEHIETVREICTGAFDAAAEIFFLNADICRADLLVEIEAVIK